MSGCLRSSNRRHLQPWLNQWCEFVTCLETIIFAISFADGNYTLQCLDKKKKLFMFLLLCKLSKLLLHVTMPFSHGWIHNIKRLFTYFFFFLIDKNNLSLFKIFILFFFSIGANVNAKDHVWLTPLHRAAASRNEVSSLCDLGYVH